MFDPAIHVTQVKRRKSIIYQDEWAENFAVSTVFKEYTFLAFDQMKRGHVHATMITDI